MLRLRHARESLHHFHHQAAGNLARIAGKAGLCIAGESSSSVDSLGNLP